MTDTYRAGFIRLTVYVRDDVVPPSRAMLIRPQLIDAVLPTASGGAILRIVGGERFEVVESVDQVLDVIAPLRPVEPIPVDDDMRAILADFGKGAAPRLSRHFDRPFKTLLRTGLLEQVGRHGGDGRFVYQATAAGLSELARDRSGDTAQAVAA